MENKIVLVSGANGDLGTHVTQAFLDAGATVIGTSRKITQSEFNNASFTAIPAELTSFAAAKALLIKSAPVSRASKFLFTRSGASSVGPLSRKPTTQPGRACSTLT
jgi:nucleoside-diphosphate-sugar epimerase